MHKKENKHNNNIKKLIEMGRKRGKARYFATTHGLLSFSLESYHKTKKKAKEEGLEFKREYKNSIYTPLYRTLPTEDGYVLYKRLLK